LTKTFFSIKFTLYGYNKEVFSKNGYK